MEEFDIRKELHVGMIVHYVMPASLECRPAVVVRIWKINKLGGGTETQDTGLCQLQVFTDELNDNQPGIMWATSVLYMPDLIDGKYHERSYHLMSSDVWGSTVGCES